MIFAFSSRMLARWIAFLYPGLPEETSIIHFHLDPPPFQNSPLSTDRGVWELARQNGAIACFVKQHMAYDDLDQAIQHAVTLVGMLSKEKIDTGLSSVSFFHLLRIDRDKRKARFLLEPSHDLYSAKVALHAHGGDVPAQGSHQRFLNQREATSLASDYLSTRSLQLSS